MGWIKWNLGNTAALDTNIRLGEPFSPGFEMRIPFRPLSSFGNRVRR